MLTGIMTIFEMAVSFRTQQIRFRPPSDSYGSSNAPQVDRDLMALLATPDLIDSIGQTVGVQRVPLTGLALCDQLLCRMDALSADRCEAPNQYDAPLFDGSPASEYVVGEQTRSTSELLIGSCALSGPQHRVLIAPNPTTDPLALALRPYRLFSCSLDQGSSCSFEQN